MSARGGGSKSPPMITCPKVHQVWIPFQSLSPKVTGRYLYCPQPRGWKITIRASFVTLVGRYGMPDLTYIFQGSRYNPLQIFWIAHRMAEEFIHAFFLHIQEAKSLQFWGVSSSVSSIPAPSTVVRSLDTLILQHGETKLWCFADGSHSRTWLFNSWSSVGGHLCWVLIHHCPNRSRDRTLSCMERNFNHSQAIGLRKNLMEGDSFNFG